MTITTMIDIQILKKAKHTPPSMDIEYDKIVPHKATDDMLEKYLDYWDREHASQQHHSILRSRDFRKKRLKTPPRENEHKLRKIALHDGEIIGMGISQYSVPEVETNPDKIWMYVFVLPEYRRKGIGTQLLHHLIEFAKGHNKTSVDTGFYPVDTEASQIWVEKLGFKRGFVEQVSRLYKDNINWDFINSKEEGLKDKLSKYSIVSYNRRSWAENVLEDDEFAEQMADYYTEVDSLLPKEDAEWNDWVITVKDLRRDAKKTLETLDLYGSVSYYAKDGDRFIATSGTYYDNDPPIRDVGTGLTGVRKAYQRQGLATYLKILVTKHYVENFPEFEFIQTENAGSNQAMLSINYALGYETVHEWHFYQGKVATIEEKIEPS